MALLLVLVILAMMSMLTLHTLVLYQQEKEFLGLEKSMQKLDWLIVNGKDEVIHLLKLDEDHNITSGELVYDDGVVFYFVTSSEQADVVALEGETDDNYAKRATFSYNRETKKMENWREMMIWN